MKKYLLITLFLAISVSGFSQYTMRYIRTPDYLYVINYITGDTLVKFLDDSTVFFMKAGYFGQLVSITDDDQFTTKKYVDDQILTSLPAGEQGDIQLYYNGKLGSADSLVSGSYLTFNGSTFYNQNSSGSNYVTWYMADANPLLNFYFQESSGDDWQILLRQGEFNTYVDEAAYGYMYFEIENRSRGGWLNYGQEDAVNGNIVNLKINSASERDFYFTMHDDDQGTGSTDQFKLDTTEFAVTFDNTEVFSITKDTTFIKNVLDCDSSAIFHDSVYFKNGTSVEWDEITRSATMDIDFSNRSDYVYIYITGATTINVSNLLAGESVICLEMDGTGYTVTKGTGWGTLMGSGTINNSANSVSLIQFQRIVPTTRTEIIRHIITSD